MKKVTEIEIWTEYSIFFVSENLFFNPYFSIDTYFFLYFTCIQISCAFIF